VTHGSKVLVIGIAGYSKTGKTTLIVKLIKSLKDKDYSIATVKDCDKSFSVDTEGKDTWKHKEAGAKVAVLNNKLESTILFKEPREMDKLIEIIQVGVRPDIILVEGDKSSELPKVWVTGDDGEDKKGVKNIIFEYHDEFDKLLELITREIELHKLVTKLGEHDCGKCGFDTCREMSEQILDGNKTFEDCQTIVDNIDLEVKSAGEPIPLNKFATHVVAGILTGLANELKGVKDPGDLEIKLKRIPEDK
jgi:molybdopterin-guanine dinucleotide biosynthesis protein B